MSIEYKTEEEKRKRREDVNIFQSSQNIFGYKQSEKNAKQINKQNEKK